MSALLEKGSRSDEESDDEGLNDFEYELRGVTEGTLFIIDSTPSMFDKGPDDDDCYFVQCLKKYEEILKHKLRWNRQDYMGLILFGTEKWDMDPEVQNVLTVQKFNLISVDNLNQIISLTNGKWAQYRALSSKTAFPLHDVLWHGMQMFYSVKIVMPIKRLILFTTTNDPSVLDNEKHRIKVKVKNFHNIGLQLHVIGFGQTWNQENFYKNLEMIARQIDHDDYEKMTLEKLVLYVKFSARSMAKLPLKMGKDCIVDVVLKNLITKTQYLQPAHVSKETNAPLEVCSYLKVVEDGNSMPKTDTLPLPVLEIDIKKYKEYGGQKIYFTLDEVASMCVTHNPSIEIICAKPILYHAVCHQNTPFFVTCNKSYRKDNELLFAGLLQRCIDKGLMLVCSVTIRKKSATSLYNLIPSSSANGFFLYKIPYREAIRDMPEQAMEFRYDDNESKPPIHSESVAFFEKLLRKLQIIYEPDLFPNPKNEVQMKALEALILDLEEMEPPEDSTLPVHDFILENVKSCLNNYMEIFGRDENEEDNSITTSTKKMKVDIPQDVTSLSRSTIQDMIAKGALDSCTIPQLKTISKNSGLKLTGKKDELLQRLKDHYA